MMGIVEFRLVQIQTNTQSNQNTNAQYTNQESKKPIISRFKHH